MFFLPCYKAPKNDKQITIAIFFLYFKISTYLMQPVEEYLYIIWSELIRRSVPKHRETTLRDMRVVEGIPENINITIVSGHSFCLLFCVLLLIYRPCLTRIKFSIYKVKNAALFTLYVYKMVKNKLQICLEKNYRVRFRIVLNRNRTQ